MGSKLQNALIAAAGSANALSSALGEMVEEIEKLENNNALLNAKVSYLELKEDQDRDFKNRLRDLLDEALS